MNDEIALFIDFENIRYSMINVQRREPDPQELIGIARRFGTIMVARAYADWTRQPEFFKGSLMAAMIDRVDCPAKVRERFRQNNGAPYNPQQNFYDRRDAHTTDDEPYAEDDGEDGEDMEQRADSLYRDDPVEAGMNAEMDSNVGDVGDDSDGVDDGDERVVLDDEQDDADEGVNGDGRLDEGEQHGPFDNGYSYNNGSNGGYYPHQPQQQIITQSTVDLNMLMDMIETVFDRPSISTFILMSGDRDFTRICARLKLRLNKRVIIVGIPGTVSRDLMASADQFLPLMVGGPAFSPQVSNHRGMAPHPTTYGPASYAMPSGPVMPDEQGFIQFLDYIDRHWSWRTVHGVANFIGDPYNPKNRFRGRLTKDSARDLLQVCVEDGILMQTSDPVNGENLRLNRDHPVVVVALGDAVGR